MSSMDFFPILQADSWFAEETRGEVFSQPLFNVPVELLEHAPRVAFALVGEVSVSYIQREYAELVNDESLQLSFSRLRAVLADLEWQALQVNPDWNLNLLVLEGNFHAAEALLLPERLQEAQSLLGAEALLVATPQRGQLLVAPHRPGQPAVTAAFISFCGDLFAEPKNEVISPIIWGVRDGCIRDRLATEPATGSAIPDPQLSATGGSTLYSLGQLVFVTLFGGLWAGLFAVALNFRELGIVPKYRLAMGAALLSIPTVLALYLHAPRTPIDRLFPIFAALGLVFLAHLTQGGLLKHAFASGARRKSLWRQILLIAGSLLMALMLVSVVVHFDLF